ncbi:hypothetical protein LZC95_35525 [Pendulispora brunnea]|uniref:Uncharacterized protein n=1 Tax=Pendulispora brunnea TaxID=2905690 RepID=A0ABZ2K2I0_9BACT
MIVRTGGSPFRSRPSRALTTTTLSIVGAGIALPFVPGAAVLGFVPLPWPFFVFLALATATYLLLVERVKRRMLRKAFA